MGLGGDGHDGYRAAKAFAVACLGYSILTLLLFRGLVGRFSTAVPHDLGDPLLSTWILWWNAHQLPFSDEWWKGLGFYPEQGSLAFSDHRVGLALLANPLQWLGGSPVLAYNVTLLTSFVLCALAAHTLTWLLTGSHAAGAVSGLVFGFSPFRISHVAHLELLAVYWLPLALAALHKYVQRFEPAWLLLFAGLWLLQGLSSGYYLFYSTPLIALWALWFARERPLRGIGGIALASTAAIAALLPVFLRYRDIQSRLGLSRTFPEIETFSADLTGILSATRSMALWRFRSLAANGEAEIYIGVFAPLTVLGGLFCRSRIVAPGARRWPRFRIAIGILGLLYGFIAAGTLLGPWSLRLGPLTLSARQTVQPFSIAILCLIIVGLTSRSFVGAFRRRSVFAFYTTAALMTWAFALGPRPMFLGKQLLYRGPYELLMVLPGFADGLRVPARFVMMTALAVSVAAGIALLRLTRSRPPAVHATATILLLLAIAADSWTFDLPMPTVPAFVRLSSEVPPSAAVLELPLGNVGHDIAAVYRSIAHGRPVVNGYSGYSPPHYRVLATGLDERDDSVLAALRTFAPLAVVIAREDDPGGGLAAFVGRQEGARRVREDGGHTIFLLPRLESAERSTYPTEPLVVGGAGFKQGTFDLMSVTDGNLQTVWATSIPQQGDEEIVLDLDDVRTVAGLSLSTGAALEGYPRRLVVSVSIDGDTWEEVWSGATAGPTLIGVLDDPATREARLAFAPRSARFLRLRQLGTHPAFAWFIAELKVYASPAS